MTSADCKQLILTQINGCLKPFGFRKKQALFYAKHDDTVQFVQLQSSRRSNRNLLVVTINLGIFSRPIAERVGNTHEPNIYEAHWRVRIGYFTPERSDKWWENQSEDDANRAASEIIDILLTKALPTMRSLASTEALKSLWRTGAGLGLTGRQRAEYLAVLERAGNQAATRNNN